ncbi:hypothetical protein D9Q98_001640 [Chlorella vulgaris]|uniref:TPX2 central domain-containing protein n=1 Tax=Chlorella vulgaris TaxID=3077 RepID=A0A9D4TVB9_CHLVU|nr:hypothetical protein D9Q98_001640 [Chlorella vulgaris]
MAAVAAPAPGASEPEVDERFEYDAPRFYDFDEGSPAGAPAADGWFDTDGPKALTSPTTQQPAEPKPAQGAATIVDNENAQQNAPVAGKGGKGKGSEWRRALGSITNTTKGGQQQGAAPQVADKHTKRKTATNPASCPAEEPEAPQAVPGSSQARPAAAAQQLQQRCDDVAAADPAQTSRPQLPSRPRSAASQLKTSEEFDLERAEGEAEAAAALGRRNAEGVRRVLQPPPPAVAHSSRPLTQPVALELHTFKRRRMHSMSTRSMASPGGSTAEQAAPEGRVAGKTRLAFGRSSDGRAAEPAPKHHPQQGHGGMASLTVPMSPQFATKRRVRPARFKPREEVEAEEMAAMPKFKARPVNKRMLQSGSGQLGVPHMDTKPPTVPEPFALKTDRRAAEHAPPPGKPDFVFTADGEGGRLTRSRATRKKAVWTGQLTQPAPFALATDVRGAIKRPPAAEPQQEAQDVRPLKRPRKAPPGPFQLATDQRGAAEQERIRGMRRQQEEQVLREAEFKAMPLNKAALAGPAKLPPSAPHELTVPRDVVLHSEARAAQRRQFDQAVSAQAAELEAERQRLQALQQQQQEAELRQLRMQLGHKALPLPDRL